MYKESVKEYASQNEINNYFKTVIENFHKISCDIEIHEMIDKLLYIHNIK